MKYEDIRETLQSAKENGSRLYIRLKSGYFYKCRIVNYTHTSITIKDKFDLASVFDIEGIDTISDWRDNSNSGGSK